MRKTIPITALVAAACALAGAAPAGADSVHTRLAFLRTPASGPGARLVTAPRGGPVRTIHRVPRRTVDAASTPGGGLTVYLQSLSAAHHSYRRQIFVSRGNGPLRPLFEHPLLTVGRQSVAISDDGTKIAYVRDRQVWVVGVNGRGNRQVTASGSPVASPVFTHDGKTVVYTRIGRDQSPLMRERLTGGTPAQITAPGTGIYLSPSLSPRNDLVYVHVASDGSSEAIETAPLVHPQRNVRLFRPAPPRFVFDPSFSPNGNSVVFASGKGATAAARRYRLMTVRASGQNPRTAVDGLRFRPFGIDWTRVPDAGRLAR